MRLALLILFASLSCSAGWYGTNWVHLNSDPNDLIANGRVDQTQRYVGQTPEPGWQMMTDAEIEANHLAYAAEQEQLRKVDSTRPRRKQAVIRALVEKVEDAGGLPKYLRVIQGQAEMLRGLWRMVNASALTNRLTTPQFNRMEANDAQLAKLLSWFAEARNAIENIETNTAPVKPTLPDDDLDP